MTTSTARDQLGLSERRSLVTEFTRRAIQAALAAAGVSAATASAAPAATEADLQAFNPELRSIAAAMLKQFGSMPDLGTENAAGDAQDDGRHVSAAVRHACGGQWLEFGHPRATTCPEVH